jgi:hypothetical protein
MSQITLVSHKHDDNVGIGMISEFFQPAGHVVVGLMLADIVDEERTDCSTVIGRGDGAVSFLTSSVPDLRLDRLCVHLNRPGGKFHPDRRLGIEIELVTGKSAQQVGFSDSGVTNKND